MQIESIHTLTAFGALADEWNQLLMESASHVPFLRHEYLAGWWSTLGGGEWENGELHIIIGRDQSGKLSGAAPIFLTNNQDGILALMLIGSVEISDYLDFIARPEQMELFINLVFDHLSTVSIPRWQALDFYNILEDSPTLLHLQSAARRHGWHYEQQRLQHCPVIPLPGDWESYLSGIDKKQRHEIRRKMRRAAEAQVPIRWYIVDSETNLEQEVEAFFDLMAVDEKKRQFLTQTMRTQMRMAVITAFREKWLQLAFLEIDGTKAAGYLNFDYDNRIWVYNSGIDYNFGSYSPGWVLLGHLLQWANENKRSHFDFMRGDEEYKYRFGGVDRFVVRTLIRR